MNAITLAPWLSAKASERGDGGIAEGRGHNLAGNAKHAKKNMLFFV
jgi:hypothetical protein